MNRRLLSRPRAVALITLIASLGLAAPVVAAPRVESVEGVTFVDSGRSSDYIVIEVRTSDATQLRVTWPGRGGARGRVANGRAGLGFARRGARSYEVSVQACRRGRCSKPRRFSGRFREIRSSTEPRANSEPVGGGAGSGTNPLSPVPTLPVPIVPIGPAPQPPTGSGPPPSAPSG